MPRSVSWLPRLQDIRRAVANSVRSHYERKDIERLFELQPRAAQNLLALLPTVPVGRAHLVEREALVRFLDSINKADDTASVFDAVRAGKAGGSRRKLRSLVRRDVEPGNIASLPETVSFCRGRLEVSFRSLEELAEGLFAVARLFEGELDALAEALEPKASPRPDCLEFNEMDLLYAELEQVPGLVPKR